MTVISEGPLCLKIHLNKAEVKHYFCSYDKIDYKNPNVKKTIEYLLAVAASSFEFENSGNLTTELYPTGSGGCVFRFTSEPRFPGGVRNIVPVISKTIREKSEVYTFIFDDIENLIKAVELIITEKNKCRYYSSLYHGNVYYLVIKIPHSDIRTAMIFNEYCTLSIKENRLEKTLSEHFPCIAKSNAAEQIGNALKAL